MRPDCDRLLELAGASLLHDDGVARSLAPICFDGRGRQITARPCGEHRADVLRIGTARERSEAEFRDLLAETGFAFRRLIPTASQVCIVESVAG